MRTAVATVTKHQHMAKTVRITRNLITVIIMIRMLVICICTYIQREREKERERDKDKDEDKDKDKDKDKHRHGGLIFKWFLYPLPGPPLEASSASTTSCGAPRTWPREPTGTILKARQTQGPKEDLSKAVGFPPLYIYIFTYLVIYLSIYLSFYLSIYLYIYMSLGIDIYIYICVYLCVYNHP